MIYRLTMTAGFLVLVGTVTATALLAGAFTAGCLLILSLAFGVGVFGPPQSTHPIEIDAEETY